MTIKNKPNLKIKKGCDSIHESLNIDKDRAVFLIDIISKIVDKKTNFIESAEILWRISETIEEFIFLIFLATKNANFYAKYLHNALSQ